MPDVRALLLFIAACGPAATPPPTISGHATAPAAPAGFTSCDLVTFDATGTVTTWKVEAGGVKKLGSAVVGAPLDLRDEEERVFAEPIQGDWADREHLFVRTAKNTVKLIAPEGISPVAIPDMEKLRPPKPADEDASPNNEGMSFSATDLVVRDGEAWWARCAWSFAYDGGYCGVWTSAQLWPLSRNMTKLVEPRRYEYPEHPSMGFATSQDEALTCISHGAKTLFAKSDDELVYGTHWIAQNPPRLLVLYGPMAEFSSPPASRWEIHDGCTAQPLAQGGSPEAGPGELWSGSEKGGFAIYRGATKIGRVDVPDPGYAQLRFRPLK